MNTTLPPRHLSPFSTPELIGINLGPYRIMELVGRGGMAAVYKAYQPGTERLVALKVMLEHFAQDSLAVQRFQQEARVIARLENRNIVPVYDSGQQDGILYLVMRYMRAGTVQDIITRGRLPLRDALSIIADVAAALDYAHALNVIHRDIKPNNILVDNLGHAYLTDFGLAKVLDAAGEFTNTSTLMGTPAYMAPEQALGRPVTPQTDIYALGVMLYEMLTGIPPFSADSPMAVALMHVQQALRPPRQVNPALTEAAELVILRALAKEPAERYQTAGEMASALAQALEVEARGVQPAHLVQVAGEIAGTKGDEELTPEIRRQLQQQDQAARSRRLLLAAPWMAVACLLAGLAGTLLFTLNADVGARSAAGQTATAVLLLLDQLNAAQTAMAAGGSGLEPTLQYLQTRLAQGPTAGATLPETDTRVAPIKTVMPTAPPINTLAKSPTPKPDSPAATSTQPPANTPTARPTIRPTVVKSPLPTKLSPFPTEEIPPLPTRLPTLPVITP